MMDFFDKFNAFDEALQAQRRKQDRINQLRSQSGKVCGNCVRWMKSRDCPAERNVNGWNHGPSSMDLRALSCPKFQRTASAESALIELQTQIAKQ